MALELFQNRKRRSFFENIAEDAAPTDYQPSPGGYPSLVRAPRMRQPEPRAPAPRLRGLAETWINGGDVGVRTNHFPNQSISAPAPGQVVAPGGGIAGAFPGRPSRAYGEKLVQARSVPVPYSEQFRREHERPEAPAPKKIGWKRRLGAAAAAFAAGLNDPEAGRRVGQQILYGPRERAYAGYERDVEDYESGLGEARQRDIGEGRRIQRELGQERLSRLRQTPMPGAGETEPEAFERKLKEAEILGLEKGTPAFNEYVSGRDLGPGGEIGLFLQDPAGYERFLEARGRHRVDRRTATEIQIALYEKDPQLYEQIFDRVGIRSEQQLRLRMAEAAMRLAETVTGQVDPKLFAQKLAELSSIVGLELENQGQPQAGRTATRQEVEAFARSKGISYEEAARQLQAEGYTIQ